MWVSRGLNRSLGGAIAAIAIVCLASSTAVLTTVSQFQAASQAREHSMQVITDIDAFLAAMLNQETGLRGYLLTGRESSLEPYRAGRAALDRAVADLRRLTVGAPSQARRLAEAVAAARSWQSSIAEIAVRDMADPVTRADAPRVEATGEGKHGFDLFRDRLGAMSASEQLGLAVQDRVQARAAARATQAVWIGGILTVLMCVAIGVAVNRRIVRPLARLAETMRRLAQRDLTVAVPGTDGQDEVGAMARAVAIFKRGLVELDRTSLLRATAETLPAMVGYVDRERRVGFLNGEFGRVFELDADVMQATGRPLAQVFAREPFPGAARELGAALAGEEQRFEHRLVRGGARRRELDVFYRPHLGPGGQVLGVVTLLTDITERKRLEARLARQARELRRSNEELEQFAYVASHDLKAPLRGIENLVTWIEEDLEGALTDGVRTNMELLKSRVRRLESLLDDLLAYSRAGRGEAVLDTIETSALVRELAVLVSPPVGFSIEAGDLPTMRAARAPLTQALQNLIGNAIKHHDHPADGRVRVSATAGEGVVEFVVADDGPGIPETFRERVFGMFQTLRPRDEVEGSGMGLAIVKKLVERHGGVIRLGDGLERLDGGHGLAVHVTWPSGDAREDHDGAGRELAAG